MCLEAERASGLAFLLNLRLAAIEARCWSLAAAERVAEPDLPELPQPASPQGARARAAITLDETGHSLYRFRTGHACHRCQKWRSLRHAGRWPTIPCARSEVQPTARAADLEPPAVQAAEDVLDFDRDLEQEADYLQEMAELFAGPEVQQPPEEEQQLVSVSAAQAARRRWQKDKRSLEATDRATHRQAAQAAASSSAADALPAALSLADLTSVEGPDWARYAHESHLLYTIDGFVICGRCGSRASRQIRTSRLTSECSRRFSPHGLQSLRRLAEGRLPTCTNSRYAPCWPNGSLQQFSSDTIKRIARPGD